uniref:Ovule protein n=1 Tax=Strongyloides venezuelensis TaxID=75913 RepID=A0A0K0EVD4_STRVS
MFYQFLAYFTQQSSFVICFFFLFCNWLIHLFFLGITSLTSHLILSWLVKLALDTNFFISAKAIIEIY